MRRPYSFLTELLLALATVVAAVVLFMLVNRPVFIIIEKASLPVYALPAVLVLLTAAVYLTVRWPDSKIYRHVLQMAVILLLLVAAEKYWRDKGFTPGSFYTSFRLTDKLEDYSFQFTDSTGMVHVDKRSKFLPAFYHHINSDGFGSNYEYDSASIARLKTTGKKLLMFIGDSYTDGWTASPSDSCFVELIDKNPAYTALNFGMKATDPVQYRLVAQRYVPRVKPDAVVVVTSYNDFLHYDRIPVPYVPLYYSCSAYTGDLWEAQKPVEFGFKPNDVLKSKEEAYLFYKKYCTMPDSNWWQRFISKSVITTLLWKAFNTSGAVIKEREYKDSLPYTYNNLKVIERLCDSLKIPMLFFHIPYVDEFVLPIQEVIKRHSKSFRELPVHFLSGLSVADHVSTTGDTHLNNSGHKKMARFTTEVLDSVFRK